MRIRHLVVEQRVCDGDAAKHTKGSGQLFIEKSKEATRGLVAQLSYSNDAMIFPSFDRKAEDVSGRRKIGDSK